MCDEVIHCFAEAKLTLCKQNNVLTLQNIFLGDAVFYSTLLIKWGIHQFIESAAVLA